jgi:small subunit ribosomal protein S17e
MLLRFIAWRKIKSLIIGGIILGKVKTEQIKKLGKELLTRFPDKFGTSFDDNKVAVNSLTEGATTRIRNKVAGYITRSVALAQAGSGTYEADETEDAEE